MRSEPEKKTDEHYPLQVGGSGVLFGLFGVLLVELLQSWKRVKRPCLELAKLLGQIIVLASEYIITGEIIIMRTFCT